LKTFRFFVLAVLIIIMHSCHVGRYFYWNFADAKDYKKFPSLEIETGELDFKFHKSNSWTDLLVESFTIAEETDFLSVFLDKHKTLAFLVIRNDTILYENYFSGYDESSVIPSFSVSKAFISALIGIAIEEGKIQSVDDPITKYIPELLESDPDFERITVEHLLNMRSGIKFNEGYANPFADMAKFYYGRNLKKYVTKLEIERPPDEAYDYISVNSLLLAMIIENATGVQLNEYVSEKLWKPLGMEFDATWSTDKKQDGQIKAFCCINGRARDFAKIGRLYLNDGNWNGEQIVPEKWVKTSLSITNDSHDSQGYPYHYQWRVLEDGSAFAKGVLGQYVFIDPKKNIIIVRMGKKSGGVNWADFFTELTKSL
jgi:CubicO group peptidase (beta-lactamase class C family)